MERKSKKKYLVTAVSAVLFAGMANAQVADQDPGPVDLTLGGSRGPVLYDQTDNAGTNGLPDQDKANTKLIELARRMDIPVAAPHRW